MVGAESCPRISSPYLHVFWRTESAWVWFVGRFCGVKSGQEPNTLPAVPRSTPPRFSREAFLFFASRIFCTETESNRNWGARLFYARRGEGMTSYGSERGLAWTLEDDANVGESVVDEA